MPNSSLLHRILRLTPTVILGLIACCLTSPASAADKIAIEINVPSRTLFLMRNNAIEATYPVGVGQPSFPTPLGRFQVIKKGINPQWQNPLANPSTAPVVSGAASPLGSRWIGFKLAPGGEYGIHGTNDPGSVGQFTSHGCVRMRNADIEAIFDRIHTETPVIVTYYPVSVDAEYNAYRVMLHPDIYHRGLPQSAYLRQYLTTHYPDAQINFSQVERLLAKKPEKPIIINHVPSRKFLREMSASESIHLGPFWLFSIIAVIALVILNIVLMLARRQHAVKTQFTPIPWGQLPKFDGILPRIVRARKKPYTSSTDTFPPSNDSI